MIKTKRAYEPPAAGDGTRFLVDRVWPRGIKKDALALKGWIKDVAPSAKLRKAFNHDPEKWDEFKRRYAVELQVSKQHWQPILEAAREGDVTLVYGARDAIHNNAAALKAFLEDQKAS